MPKRVIANVPTYQVPDFSGLLFRLGWLWHAANMLGRIEQRGGGWWRLDGNQMRGRRALNGALLAEADAWTDQEHADYLARVNAIPISHELPFLADA